MSSRAVAATATWDAHAERYGAQERLETRAIAALLRLADPGPDDRLVDLGTGTGAVLRALAARPGRPEVAIGIDRSRRMLDRVGALPSSWRTVQADADCVPLPDGAADVVTCSYLLHLLGPDERARVLGEACRLLAPGPRSRLVITTVWADRATTGGRAVDGALRALARARPRAWGGLRPFNPVANLGAAGLAPTHRVVLPRGGYPSLVVRARRSVGRPRTAGGLPVGPADY